MDTKAFILKTVKAVGEISSSVVVKALKISRQTAAQHLRELVATRKLVKLGSTVDARYVPYGSAKAGRQPPAITFKTVCRLPKADESSIFEQADLRLRLRKRLSEKAYRIVRFAFTEMVNNAIDHSRAASASVEMKLVGGDVEFTIRDKGIGAFESVRARFHLHDHFEALEHLMKGKQTTAPRHHSGQGIFFTSKAADIFCLKSARLKWTVDNLQKDVFVDETRARLPGTEVTFRIRHSTARDLKAIFDAYSNEDYEFDKSKVLVRLSPKQSEYVSRSEAKRLLFGLEKFKRIVFDFLKVKSVGQGFADEIFRVFPSRYPGIHLEPQNMTPAVRFMVERAIRAAALQ
ncbi:MAG: DUF4325 domain-containing protein [Candidatus Omnitrophota bacterium]